MSEVEKMYENCNIKPKQEGYCDWDSDCPYPDIINSGCGDECPYWKYEDEATYPPFTADKQLGLIKWMIKTNHRYFIQDVFECEFEESLAKVLNLYWQDLTESEQEQIKRILE